MNYSLISLEIAVVLLGLVMLLVDLWLPSDWKRKLGYGAAAVLALIFLYSFSEKFSANGVYTAFAGSYVLDGLAMFFKRFFLLATIFVLLLSVEFGDRIESAVSEYYCIQVFALAGMMFAASANDFMMLFVSIELITVSFYILVSYQRRRLTSLEAGVKYLILGALSSAFLIFGIAMVFGMSGTVQFEQLAEVSGGLVGDPVFLFGLLMVLSGLGFKIAAFPFQIWAPDVYQGAPAPTTAFLAVGSKAAGFVLLLRVFFSAVPEVTWSWHQLLMLLSAVTILYGNLCALPQRNMKRLLGYSSIAHAGYLLLGVAAANAAGATAVLYYLSGYLFTVVAAFLVIVLVMRTTETEEIESLAGLNQRSPLLALTMTLAMVSLAGIPPLAGFFGKFLLLKSVIEQAATNAAFYWLAMVAVAGVVISLYYYFGVVRVIYWSRDPDDRTAIEISRPLRGVMYACMAGIILLGIWPAPVMDWAANAVRVLKF